MMQHEAAQIVTIAPPPSQKAATISVAALLLSNAIPAVGVLFFGWDTFEIVLLFWWENVAFGFVHLARMATAAGDKQWSMHLFKPFAMAAFLALYGFFIAAYGNMTLQLLGEERLGWSPGDWGPDFFGPPFYALAQLWPEMWVSIVAVAASHLVSYAVNDLYGGEFRITTVQSTIRLPYDRLVVSHLAMAFGALAIATAGAPSGLLVLLMALKTLADLRAHRKQHSRIRPGATA